MTAPRPVKKGIKTTTIWIMDTDHMFSTPMIWQYEAIRWTTATVTAVVQGCVKHVHKCQSQMIIDSPEKLKELYGKEIRRRIELTEALLQRQRDALDGTSIMIQAHEPFSKLPKLIGGVE